MPSDLNNPTIGLVLSGGGGKGAYQIGCWKTLLKFGLTNFKVISGTSVGALNAALIAMGDYERAQEIWEQLREEKVLKTSKAKKWLVACRFYLSVLLKLFLFYLFFWAMPLLAIALIIFLLPLQISENLNHPLPYWMFWVLGIVTVVFLCIVVKKSRAYLTWTWGEARTEAVKELGLRLWIGSNKPLSNLLRQHVDLATMKARGVRVYATVTVWASYGIPMLTPRSRGLGATHRCPHARKWWGSRRSAA